MKFKVGDKVLVTAGKDKGKKSTILKVLPKSGKAVVKDINLYTRHVKPYGERAGEKIRKERALNLAKIAILNDKDQADRIKIKVLKNGKKERVFAKTGKSLPVNNNETKK